ncbi:glycosyltransferase [Sinomonas sp. P10A9]|uniref:Glycosyltransferase n=1 Tax=Sinomonas puerhi TaxID=3238584 RepID=A0AB39L2D5_9MICC
MSTILAYTSPATGHLFPMTPLLLELRSRGHRVHVRTFAEHVETLRGLGLEAEPTDARIAAIWHQDFSARNPLEALSANAETFTQRAEFDGADAAASLRDVAPDAAIVDINAWGAAAAAQAWGGPWASFSPYVPPISSAGTPPFGPGLAPRGGPLGRIRDATLRSLIMGQLTKRYLGPINSVRAEHGLAPVDTVDQFFRSAPLMLVTTSEPFDYAHTDWLPQIRSIGALPWEPPSEVPAWVDEPGDPFALVTTSSEYQADEALARAAVAGLAEEPYRVVVTMPAGVADLGPLPPNVRIEQFVPHGPILARAAVAVTHGGMGATQKALGAGVPTVVVPWGRDQLEVGARVAHAHAGVRLSKGRLTPERLRDAVRRAAGMADGAGRVAAGYRAAGGAAAGADAVEELLRT